MELNLFFNLFIFLFGLIIGSFLNCLIYRLSIPKGRSFCLHCKHILSWKDLIPVLSFFILRGKCRYCGKKISWQYPLVEITTGLLFVSIFNFSPFGGPAIGWQNLLNTFYLLLTTCFLIIIFVYDLKHYIIPDKIIYPAIIITLIFNYYSILSAFGAALFFLFIVLISKGRWMGLGDVKLAFLMGLFLGFPQIIVGLFLAFLIGAIIGIGLILVKKKTLKSEVPFGPFLVTGTFISLFFGEKIIQWYLNLFIY